jgi:hypothetical protein
MEVSLESIQQTYSLDNGAVVTWAVIRLPTGQGLNVRLQDGQAEAIMAAASGDEAVEESQYAAPPPAQQQTVYHQPAVRSVTKQEELVAWAELSDDEVPEQVKQVLHASGVDPVLPVDQLVELVDEVTERIIQQAERQVQQPAPMPPAPAPVIQAPKPLGVVQRRLAPARRTVPMDERGYPMVPGMVESDPGELAMDADEDGIGQV